MHVIPKTRPSEKGPLCLVTFVCVCKRGVLTYLLVFGTNQSQLNYVGQRRNEGAGSPAGPTTKGGEGASSLCSKLFRKYVSIFYVRLVGFGGLVFIFNKLVF